jgi:hypothetical protein
MPTAEIASKQAVYTLGLLHAELAGKLLANKREAIRLRTAMMQVEAVVKMLQPRFNVASIAAKRRNKSNPWFKARDAIPERGGRAAAGWHSNDGTGDCRRPDGRQGPSGDPKAGHRLAGG